MIEHPFLSIPAKTACSGKVRLIFSKISRATRLAGFESIMLPLDINRSLYNVLMSQEVRGMQASAQVWYTFHNNAWWLVDGHQSNRSLYNVLVSQEVRGMHAVPLILRVPTNLKGTDWSQGYRLKVKRSVTNVEPVTLGTFQCLYVCMSVTAARP